MNKISVVIPIYNEANSIEEIITRFKSAFSIAKNPYELIFVDDHSTDETDQIFKEIKNDGQIKLLKKQGKQGKAFSLIEGFEAATGEIIAMIDGDLQYPPEAIPEMVKSLDKADIIVSNRKDYQDSKLRKVISNTFRIIFGKFLFGLPHDVQSGLKIMTREVIETIKFKPESPWTFDLEFLHRAKQAGFVIENYDIIFSRRKNDASKLSSIKTSFEIGLNALKVKAKTIHPIRIAPQKKGTMLGAGVRYKKRKYITHTTIPHNTSALRTLTFRQKMILILLVEMAFLGLVLAPLRTLQIMVAVLSFIYFIDVLFNLYLILKSLRFPQEIVSSDEELNILCDRDLPVYTILCPLYREVHVLPQFLKAIGKISWPKNKLDVILLLEEDDIQTIQKARQMNLPSYVRTLVVPHSMPKTKPKACNFGLAHAKGEYLVIYDAEDMPDPMQLKKAYLGFQKADKDIICLQAKLNYYNPQQNLLTRLFTAEYSLWFDITLTGLQSINTSIPLGGTSNHFRTESLREVEGWDPFNVTEDADLGIRLFRRGYRTAIIDSTTLEEANSKLGNWLRQRSRWIKGYMQTYLVHIRDSFKFTREQGKHSLIFQLVIGGKIAFILINPLLWLATISYFALYAYVGPQIEALYPSVVFYMAVTSLVFGNFLSLYYYMIGAAKKGQWNLMKFVFLVPVYWFFISIAALIALYQLIFKPHYWEKTIHGFHLKPSEDLVVDLAIETEKKEGFVFPKKLREKLALAFAGKHSAAGAIVMANLLANILNFAYSAYLGRVLTFEDFALIGLVNGLISLVAVIFGSLGTTMTHRTGYLMGRFGENAAIAFWAKTREKALKMSIVLSILWILVSPFLVSFFKLSGLTPLLLFFPIILVSSAAVSDRGLLLSKFSFKSISALTIAEPLIKFLLAVFLVYFGLKNWAYATIPLSAAVTFLIGWSIVYKNKAKIKNYVHETNYSFPSKFFLASLFSGVSAIIFLNLDVILAKHYLTPSDAGLYTLTALIGKMVFFLGGLASPFTIAFVSVNEGKNVDSRKFLNLTILATLALSLPAFIAIALFGQHLIPFMFGAKAVSALPFITFISFGMVCYSVSRVYTDYYLAKKYYSFPVVALILGIFQLALLEIFHGSIWSFVYIMSGIWVAYLFATISLHIFSSQVKTFENNVADLLGLFAKAREYKSPASGKLRILIFNWRDTRHIWAGGAEVYAYELAKRWVKEGNRVAVFCGNVGKLPKNEVIDGVQIYRRGGFYMVYVWAFFYYMLKFRGKFDVIIDSENGIPFFTPLYAKEKKFLLIHHVHQEVFRKSLK
ncbi:MAG: glycosyltransferase, partial [bacterium]|nr:glycosyltransferase [bacterium]